MRCARSEQDNASLTALIKELRSTHCLGDSALSVGVGLVVGGGAAETHSRHWSHRQL